MPERPPLQRLAIRESCPRVIAQPTQTLDYAIHGPTHAAMHFYTVTDSGLVQFGNARWPRAGSVMSGNDDVIKEAVVFSFG